MGYVKPKEKLNPIDEWTNFRNAIAASGNYRSKELLTMTEEWIRYTPQERAQAYHDWDEYYELCFKSPSAVLFRDMVEMMKHKDVAALKTAKEEMQNLKDAERIQKPRSIDPYLIRHNQTCSTYMRLTFAAKASQETQEKITA